MIARREIWEYPDDARVWAGKYRNSHNLLHWHYDCELVCVEEGSIDIFCERGKYTLEKGEALFTDSGQIHYQRAAAPDTVLMVIIFDYNILRPFLDAWQLACPKLGEGHRVAETYRELFKVLTERKPFYGAEAACIVAQRMIDIFRRDRILPRPKSGRTEETFKRLLEEIHAQYQTFTFEDAVRFMGMSDAYFSRYFKAMAGTTFSQYLNYVRTENAVRLLREGGMTMTEIADACGFATIRNFNRIFRALTGTAPSRLPENYVLQGDFAHPSDRAFSPTLFDCKLIESSARPL